MRKLVVLLMVAVLVLGIVTSAVAAGNGKVQLVCYYERLSDGAIVGDTEGIYADDPNYTYLYCALVKDYGTSKEKIIKVLE